MTKDILINREKLRLLRNIAILLHAELASQIEFKDNYDIDRNLSYMILREVDSRLIRDIMKSDNFLDHALLTEFLQNKVQPRMKVTANSCIHGGGRVQESKIPSFRPCGTSSRGVGISTLRCCTAFLQPGFRSTCK